MVDKVQVGAETLYIAVREKTARDLARRGYRMIWWPVAVFTLEDCGRNNPYLTDCYVCGITGSARARLLLTTRLDKNVEIRPNPPIQAVQLPRSKCTMLEYSQALRELWSLVQPRPEARRSGEDSWSRSISPERLALAHILSPTSWILGPMENMKISIAEDIALSLVRGMLEQLCVERGPPINSWKQAYALVAVNTRKKAIELLYGSKKRRNRVLEKYFFEHPEVSSRVGKILEL